MRKLAWLPKPLLVLCLSSLAVSCAADGPPGYWKPDDPVIERWNQAYIPGGHSMYPFGYLEDYILVGFDSASGRVDAYAEAFPGAVPLIVACDFRVSRTYTNILFPGRTMPSPPPTLQVTKWTTADAAAAGSVTGSSVIRDPYVFGDTTIYPSGNWSVSSAPGAPGSTVIVTAPGATLDATGHVAAGANTIGSWMGSGAAVVFSP